MNDEKIKLNKEIDELEAQIAPKQERLREIYQKEHDDVEAKIKRVNLMQDKFTLDEIRFAAYVRCDCGAGMAYPKNIGSFGHWYCSDILLGRAVPKDDANSKSHLHPMPFTFYEIKSEDQPSANGATTRPNE